MCLITIFFQIRFILAVEINHFLILKEIQIEHTPSPPWKKLAFNRKLFKTNASNIITVVWFQTFFTLTKNLICVAPTTLLHLKHD
jgi:hypothetical protein